MKVLKEAWYYVLAYFTNYLFPKIKEYLLGAKDKFIEMLWEEIKEEAKAQVKSTIEYIEKYFNTSDYEAKEKAIITTVCDSLNLPLFLKPFRPLLKRILKGKFKKLVSKHLKKLNQKV